MIVFFSRGTHINRNTASLCSDSSTETYYFTLGDGPSVDLSEDGISESARVLSSFTLRYPSTNDSSVHLRRFNLLLPHPLLHEALSPATVPTHLPLDKDAHRHLDSLCHHDRLHWLDLFQLRLFLLADRVLLADEKCIKVLSSSARDDCKLGL